MTSPLQQIKLYCVRYCPKYISDEVSAVDCPYKECPLYELRTGKRPNGNNISEERREELRAIGRKMARNRLNSSIDKSNKGETR
jgi:hypothetical protein